VSTSATRPAEPDNGRPPAEPGPRRGLRDRPLGRVLLLVIVLAAAALAARTCAAQDKQISQDEAIEIAIESVGFQPCAAPICVQIRYLQRGIPVRGYWLVGLARDVDDNGEPVGARSVLVDVQSGEVSSA
jgi:hypothetical protein